MNSSVFYQEMGRQSRNGNRGSLQTVKVTEEICPFCYLTVAPGDPEKTMSHDGKYAHGICAKLHQ
ncbi:MAG: hypothetical protein Q8O93_01380 [bacterium]|nr:hypothetical protein [bacterium]